jgi:hypothetical protein
LERLFYRFRIWQENTDALQQAGGGSCQTKIQSLRSDWDLGMIPTPEPATGLVLATSEVGLSAGAGRW